MAIFASRRVNVDPEPWVGVYGQRWGTQGDPEAFRKFDPRPEFDNVVNPVLVEFREDREGDAQSGMTLADSAAYSMRTCELYWWDPAENVTQEHCNHARRVLQKLAAFRG